jgi:hypothetical protein
MAKAVIITARWHPFFTMFGTHPTAQVSGFRQVSNHGMANITHPKRVRARSENRLLWRYREPLHAT